MPRCKPSLFLTQCVLGYIEVIPRFALCQTQAATQLCCHCKIAVPH